jgi:hypothetical protein
MKREVGDRNFPIWLLGDSNPEQWQESLATPFDPRHPIRHNIWTSVLDVIQDNVFRAKKIRVETKTLFIRNAVENPLIKPKPTDIEWGKKVEIEIAELREIILTYKPKLLLSFGAFSFEFARRSHGQEPKRNYSYWGSEKLGVEFRQRINEFDPNKINILPLLHRSVSGGKFIQSQNNFCNKKGANYFEYVGISIEEKLLQFQYDLDIWVK